MTSQKTQIDYKKTKILVSYSETGKTKQLMPVTEPTCTVNFLKEVHFLNPVQILPVYI